MSDDAGGVFYPVLSGLAAGERVVTSGSFLVDAETRLNPAAGSIYFGGSGGAQNSGAPAAGRAATPGDPDAQNHGALAQIAPGERKIRQGPRLLPRLFGN